MQSYPVIAFIGVGNMAQAMIHGLLVGGYPPAQIRGFCRNPAAMVDLAAQGVGLYATVQQAVAGADLVILAVKPWQTIDLAGECNSHLASDTQVASIAAGITIAQLAMVLPDRPLTRLMPNTPVASNQGVIGCFAHHHCRQIIDLALHQLGTLVWLEHESHMHALTAIAGCGPAYYFRILQHMQQIAIDLGLPARIAGQLALHTLVGAGALAQRDARVEFEQLIGQITSKGSATGMGLDAMENQGLFACLNQGVRAAHTQAIALADYCPENPNP